MKQPDDRLGTRPGAGIRLNEHAVMDETTQPTNLDREAGNASLRSGSFDGEGLLSDEEQRALGAALKSRIERMLPSPDLLVPYALFASGRKGDLTETELASIRSVQGELRQLEEDEPFFADVIKRISDEAETFAAYWDAEVDRPRRKPSRRLRPAVASRRSFSPSRNWRIAALVSAAAVAVMVIVLVGDTSQLVRVTANEGLAREVLLEDGSTVRLMPGASLSYDATPETVFSRSVELEGDAYFVVATAADRPFRVQTPELTVTVVGTRFGISEGKASSEVVLATGEIHVASAGYPDEAVVLRPGTKSIVLREAPPSAPMEVDVVDALGWTGLFVFRGETYERIAEHLTSHYGIHVTADDNIRSDRLSGTFDKSSPLSEILSTIERSGGLSAVDDTEGGLVFREKP